MAEQQAQFWADLRAIESTQAETARLLEKDRQHVAENRQRIAQLVDVCMSLARHGEETDRRIHELRESHLDMDQRLSALIHIVDSLVKRNGGPN